jgi:hypothetical protein
MLVAARRSRRQWLSFGLMAGLCFAAGCITPTLPPDDPPIPDVELGVGVARLRGSVGGGEPAYVLVHNRVSGLVFGQRTATGDYDFQVPTAPCDLLALWYTAGSFQSTAVTFKPGEVAGVRGACPRGAPSDAGAPLDEGSVGATPVGDDPLGENE